MCSNRYCKCLESCVLYCMISCCFTQNTSLTEEQPKGVEHLVQQLIQQIEQLQEDKAVAQLRELITDLQVALGDERMQKENAVNEERRELQQRLLEQDRHVAGLRQYILDLQDAWGVERREHQELQQQIQQRLQDEEHFQQLLNEEQREKACLVELLSDAEAAIERYKQDNEVFNIPSHDIQLTGTELGRGSYGGEMQFITSTISI